MITPLIKSRTPKKNGFLRTQLMKSKVGKQAGKQGKVDKNFTFIRMVLDGQLLTTSVSNPI
jgi:hypothetical protein